MSIKFLIKTIGEKTSNILNNQQIKLIRNLDNGSGVDYEEILKRLKEGEGEKLIQNLMLQGDVFEVKPGKLKILE